MIKKEGKMASCNKPVMTQIIRGVIGIGLLVGAAFVYKTSFELSVLLIALSLIPLKGCPVCWIVETCEVADKAHRDKQKEQPKT